jgi:hypothetical protein
VDRGRDGPRDDLGAAEQRRLRAELEPAGGKELAKELVSPVLLERHLAAGDLVEGRLADVVDPDPEAGPREGEAEREADVSGTAEDHDVEVGLHRENGSSPWPGREHAQTDPHGPGEGSRARNDLFGSTRISAGLEAAAAPALMILSQRRGGRICDIRHLHRASALVAN